MLHLKNNGYLPKDASTLLGNARHLSSDMDVVVRDARVSSKFLEFDVSIKKQNLDDLLDNLFQIADLEHVKEVVEEKKDVVVAKKDGMAEPQAARRWGKELHGDHITWGEPPKEARKCTQVELNSGIMMFYYYYYY